LYNHLLYFTYWLFNSIVLYVFGLIFPRDVVLGNWRFGPIEAAVYAGFWVTFLIWTLWDFAIAKGVKFESATVTLGYFWAANIFGFWLVSRFSEYAGLGITSYLWALAIGLVAFLMQRLAWRLVVGKKTEV
jgi:hypothetical protein